MFCMFVTKCWNEANKKKIPHPALLQVNQLSQPLQEGRLRDLAEINMKLKNWYCASEYSSSWSASHPSTSQSPSTLSTLHQGDDKPVAGKPWQRWRSSLPHCAEAGTGAPWGKKTHSNTFGKEAKDVAIENEHWAANTSQFRFYLMGEKVKNVFKPCCRSPSLPSSPQRQTAKNKFFCLFLDLFEILIAPVHTGVQWHQDGSPLGPEGQSLGPASLQPRPTPSPACGRWRQSRTGGPPVLALPSSSSPPRPPQPPCGGGPVKQIKGQS